MKPNNFLLRSFVFYSWIAVVLCFEFEVQNMEIDINPDPFWDLSNLNTIRIRSGVYGFNGTMVLSEDLDDSILFELKVFYSATGNSQFVRSPMKVSPMGFCVALNTKYKKFLMKSLSEKSDFPYIAENEQFCPLKAGTYNVYMYEFDKAALPSYIKPGLYRLNFCFTSTKDGRQASWSIYAKLSND